HPALDHSLVEGHSLGGLVSRLLTFDSGDDFWRLVSKKPSDELTVRPDTREELRPIFFFRRDPSVERVVFIGTPHHGATLSPSPPAQLAARFITLPKPLL